MTTIVMTPSLADNLIQFTLPLWTPDWDAWVRALGSMFAEVEAFVNEQGDPGDPGFVPGWGGLFDPDTCGSIALPYLAQIAGERLQAGVPDADARVLIRTQPNAHRCTPAGIARAAQKALTGTRIVQILARTHADGSPDPNGDDFIVYTYTDQTPDPNRVLAELANQIPAGMNCHYEAVTGATWAGLEVGHPTWAALEAEYPTWSDMAGAHPGATVWSW